MTREWAIRERVALAPGLVTLLADMRAAVTTYVDRRRAAGTPVQRVLPEVKALVRGAVSGVEMGEVAELLLTHAVRWSIEAYYAPDGVSRVAVPSAAPNAQPGGGRVPRSR